MNKFMNFVLGFSAISGLISVCMDIAHVPPAAPFQLVGLLFFCAALTLFLNKSPF